MSAERAEFPPTSITTSSTTGAPLESIDEVFFYSLDPFEQMTSEIVDMVNAGGFDFLDPIQSSGTISEAFDKSFLQLMTRVFGTENGAFLHKRFKQGKASPRLKRQIESLFQQSVNIFRRQNLVPQNPLFAALCALYRKAYKEGGLKRVDEAIAMLNEKLMNAGVRYGFGPGTACMQDENGNPEWVAIIISDLERHEFLCMEWCGLSDENELDLF